MILTSRRCSLIFLHTIEICFNCFGARSFDTKNIKRRQKTPRNSNFTLIIDTPSPFLHAWERGGVSKMARGPEGDKWVPCKFLTTVPLAYFWSVDSIDFKFAHVLQCNKLFCLSVHGTSHLTFNKSQFFQIRTTYIFEMFFSSNEQRQHKINSRYLYCRL